MTDPCPNADTTSVHQPSCVEISFGPQHTDSSSDQEDNKSTISNTVTVTTTSSVVEPATNSNNTGDDTSSLSLRRSSCIAVMPKKSFADTYQANFTLQLDP